MRRWAPILLFLLVVVAIALSVGLKLTLSERGEKVSNVTSGSAQSETTPPEVDIDKSDGSENEGEVERRRAIETALDERGMGNLKVLDLPSKDPEFYRKKMYETDSIIPDPDYLKNSPRPVVFREYVHKYMKEPLDASELSFLEKKLASATDSEVRLQCASLLYRYGHVSGEEYLASRLQASDSVHSATILAINHETKYLPQILEILLDQANNTTASYFNVISDNDPLIRAVSTWNEPSVSDAISRIATQRDVLTPGLLFSIALHGTSEAEGRLRSIVSQHSDDIGLTYQLAALYKLTGDTHYTEEIEERIHLAFSEMQSADSDTIVRGTIRCSYAIDSLNLLGSNGGRSALMKIVADLDALPAGLNLPEGLVPGDPLKDLMVKAVVSYSILESEVTSDSDSFLISALESLPENENVRLGVAMALGEKYLQGHPELKRLIGQNVVDRSNALKALRVLPAYLVPDTSVFVMSERDSMFPT